MKRFRVTYRDPATGETEQIERKFEDWTGYAEIGGKPFGPLMTITAEEWAKDLGYTLADKGPYSVEEISA